jgi:uncharacterized protein
VHFAARPPIDGYGAGGFRIGGFIHPGGLLALPARVAAWSPADPMTPACFADALAAAGDIDILLVGMGADIAPLPAQTLAALDDATLIGKWAKDPAIIASGETIYNTNCTACHGADLSATLDAGGQKFPLPGRSLIDGIWEYGGKPNDIIKLVKNGSPAEAKGMNGALMQSWSATLTTKQIAEVTAFIISKNPKEYNLEP